MTHLFSYSFVEIAYISQMLSLGKIFEKWFLDEIILDWLWAQENKKKSRNHDLPKCYQEIRFDIWGFEIRHVIMKFFEKNLKKPSCRA